jgi:hypothetical protein
MKSAVMLVLATIGSAVSPAMAAKDTSKISEKSPKISPELIKKLLEYWPHTDDGVEVKWAQSTHMLIAEKTGNYMGISGSNLSNFKLGSKLPDEEDSAWWPPWCPERLCKHVYDPVFRFGSAPQACNEKVESAINYAQNGKYTEAYLDLGRASHYLMDVGNPYHSNLFTGNPAENKVRHDFYEQVVYSKWDDWNLDDIAYNAPKITVTDPQKAVKDLAFMSYWYKDDLDSAIGVYWVNNVPVPYIKDEAKLKQTTQFLVKKVAGYTKGLIEYFEDNI